MAIFLAVTPAAHAQNPQPATNPPNAPTDKITKKDADPETELQKAIADAGNDRGALVRNLKNYLKRFPDAPRKAAVFRALVESCEQVQDDACALEYAEQLIALRPDDSEIMMLAVNLLQKQGDEASLTRASGYVTRVLDRVEKSSPRINRRAFRCRTGRQSGRTPCRALQSPRPNRKIAARLRRRRKRSAHELLDPPQRHRRRAAR